MMLSKFWNDAEAMVLPQIFNDRYLKLDQFEKVDYWQNINEPEKIDVIPAIIDTNEFNKFIDSYSEDNWAIRYSLKVLYSVLYRYFETTELRKVSDEDE